MPEPVRLQVFLSHSGVCSRRKAMELIFEGHVTVNGQLQKEPSTKVTPGVDQVSVDGKPVESKSYTYVLLNKPRDYVCTTAVFEGEKSVLTLLPEQFHHLVPVGRLDKDTEGLLLLTNDGDLAYKLTHPKFNVDKTYFVCVYGMLQQDERRKLERGVEIKEGGTFPDLVVEETDEEEAPVSRPQRGPGNKFSGPRDPDKSYKTAPAKISEIKPYTDRTRTEFLLTLHEGKKRQIRLMCEAVGHKVAYLKRVAQGELTLGDLQTGKWRELTPSELLILKKSSGSTPSVKPAHGQRSENLGLADQRKKHPDRERDMRTVRYDARPARDDKREPRSEAREEGKEVRKKSYFDRFKKIQKRRGPRE